MRLALAKLDDGSLLAAEQALSPAERQRLVAIRRPLRQQQFLLGRWLARQLLCEQFSQELWQLSADYAQPARVLGNADIFLSIAHSAHWVACVLASSPVGLDIECAARTRDVQGMVEWFASPYEQTVVLSQPSANTQQSSMLTFWTLKEAWLKQHTQALDFNVLPTLDMRPASQDSAQAVSVCDVQQQLVLSMFGDVTQLDEATFRDLGLQGKPSFWCLAPEALPMGSNAEKSRKY